MRVLRLLLLGGVLLAALVVTSVGWYRSAHQGGNARFDSCAFDGDILVLTWTNGVDSYVSPSVDVRGGRIVVGLREEMPDGPHIALGLHGEARFTIHGQERAVRYSDGTALDCPTA